jgi:hypothetical protein
MSRSSPDSVDALAWARVYAAVARSHSKSLRRGTWYPVVSNDMPDRVSLRVGPEQVDVPRNLLEIRDKRPVHFSVVSRVSKPGPGGIEAHHPGKHYLVCPDCDHRNAFFGQPAEAICKECGYRGEIAWWDS